MTDVALKGAYLQNVRGVTIADGGGVTWAYDPATNTLSVSGLSGTAIAADSVSNTELANMAQGTIKGRASGAGTGDPTDLTAAQVKTILALTSTDISDFTEAAQDAVLNAMVDSSSIDFTYTDASNNWTAAVLPAGVNHNLLLNYVADQHVAHSGVTLTAGAGLTGGGDISAGRTFDVGAGTGITVNANDVAIDQAFTPTWSGAHIFTASITIKGDTVTTIYRNSANAAVLQAGTVKGITGAGSVTDAALGWFGTNLSIIDANTGRLAVNIARTAYTFGNTTDNPSYTFTGTGAFGIGGTLAVAGNSGFNGTAPIAKPTITGSRGGNAALASLLTALANYGLITDSTTA